MEKYLIPNPDNLSENISITAEDCSNEQLIYVALKQSEEYSGNISPFVGKELTNRSMWQTLQNIINPNIRCRI